MVPRSARIFATSVFTASSSRMSQACQLTLPPSSTISPAVFSSFSALRPTSTTWAPRAAKPPTRLVRSTVSKPFWLIEARGEGYWPPALLTR